MIDNIEDYNLGFLPNYPYSSAVLINNISNVFDCQDHMVSNMDSILTMMKEYMNQNKVKFDMNDFLVVIDIDVNQ